MDNLFTKKINTPIGYLYIETDDCKVLRISFENTYKKEKLEKKEKYPKIMEDTILQLEEYFQGKRKKFDLPLARSNTEFKNKVYEELIKTRYGSVSSYKDIAIKIGNHKASRAIGNANNKNEIPIIIPCHRIVGSNGKLVGYAGGLFRKQWLIDHERNHSSEED